MGDTQEEGDMSEEQLRECWDASAAYMLGNSSTFKQTHPDFKSWLAAQPKELCRWTLEDMDECGDSTTECGEIHMGRWGNYCPKCGREIEVQP
jgi:hypothetical protein